MTPATDAQDTTTPPFALPWRPEPGDTLAGEVRAWRVGTSPFGRMEIVVVRDEGTGSDVAVWLSCASLRREFDEQRPARGDRIALRFVGKGPGQQGRKTFALAVERA